MRNVEKSTIVMVCLTDSFHIVLSPVLSLLHYQPARGSWYLSLYRCTGFLGKYILVPFGDDERDTR